MAWTAPRTWVTGELVTSALMNTQVRDNFSFLHGAPKCLVRQSGNQFPPANGFHTMAWDLGASYDTDGMFSAAANTRITFNTAGKYLVGAAVLITGSAGGSARELFVQHSVAGQRLAEEIKAAPHNSYMTCGPVPWAFGAGEYIQALYFNDGTTGGTLAQSNAFGHMYAVWIGG